MKIAVIIVHFADQELTFATLDSLRKTTLPSKLRSQVYVVDNTSSEDFEEDLIKKYPEVKLVASLENRGFAGGNNLGLKEALADKNDIFVLLNNDTLVKKDFYKKILSSPITKKDVGIVGGLIYFAPGFEFKKKYKKEDIGKVIWYGGGQIDWDNVYISHRAVDQVDKGQFKKVEENDFVTGCLLITKREVLEKVGLLSEKMFLYLEDADFNLRVKRAGYKIIFDPRIKIWHKVAQSSGIGSPLNDYFLTRNRLLFGFKYARPRVKLALLREAFRKKKDGTKAQKAAVKDFLSFNFGKGSWLK